MSLLVASLYLLCLAFLFGSALYVYSRNPLSRINATFALLALSLLGWVGTLFVFTAQTFGPELLWLGRANFAAAALAAPATVLFVIALARRPLPHGYWIWIETGLWILLSLLTGSIDKAETVQAGLHVTSYGILFPLYVVHIVAFLAVAIFVAFRPDPSLPRLVRIQMRWVGIGILITAVVSLITNAVLPYLYGNFRYIDTGTLATIFFLAAVSFAAVRYELFDLHLLLRRTIIFAILIAFALELYQLAVEFLAQLLPLGDSADRHAAAAAVALIINAFTHEPLRALLERVADRLLADRKKKPHPSIHRRVP